MPIRVYVFSAMLSLLSTAGDGIAATDIRTAAQQGTEPKFQGAGDGRVAGVCIDIMRAIERLDSGLRFTGDQVWQPLPRIYSSLDRGMQDASCGLSRNPERERKYLFVGPALFTIRYYLVARIDDTAVVGSWDDLRRLEPDNVVLANRGFAGVGILEQAGVARIDAGAGDPKLNLQKLLAHRGRFFFHRTPGLKTLLERAGVAAKVKILPTEMAASPLYFMVSRRFDPALAERLRAALQTLEKSGELERIAKSWE
ncbi:ABC transporter substrate-binding protein [Duganella sp. BJB1802]|uniref:substrate-binding periplasmic protein n=1 Tax=Duganella sp. BJB1802 TaxID=2744575 RepID=UPI001E51B5F9|nr:transporter substrate-binding domain-containing protein [Duganella sp. BJB1802]